MLPSTGAELETLDATDELDEGVDELDDELKVVDELDKDEAGIDDEDDDVGVVAFRRR